MNEIIWIIIGALLGAGLGYAITKIRLCSSGACRTKANLIFSIIAGAVFGAGVARFLMGK